jgi:hypothetical protein
MGIRSDSVRLSQTKSDQVKPNQSVECRVPSVEKAAKIKLRQGKTRYFFRGGEGKGRRQKEECRRQESDKVRLSQSGSN